MLAGPDMELGEVLLGCVFGWEANRTIRTQRDERRLGEMLRGMEFDKGGWPTATEARLHGKRLPVRRYGWTAPARRTILP